MASMYIVDLAGLRPEDYEHCSIMLGGSGRQVLPGEELLEAQGVDELAEALASIMPDTSDWPAWREGHFLFVVRWGDSRAKEIVTLLDLLRNTMERTELAGIIGNHLMTFHHFRRLTPEEMEEFEMYDDPETAQNALTLAWDQEEAERALSVFLAISSPRPRLFAKMGEEYYSWHGGMELP